LPLAAFPPLPPEDIFGDKFGFLKKGSWKTEVERNYALKVVCSGELMSVVVRLKNGWTREGERKRDVGDGVAFIVELRQVASHSVSGRGGGCRGTGLGGWLVAGGRKSATVANVFPSFFILFPIFYFLSQIHSSTELSSHLDGLGLTYKWNDAIGSTRPESVWVAFRSRNFSNCGSDKLERRW